MEAEREMTGNQINGDVNSTNAQNCLALVPITLLPKNNSVCAFARKASVARFLAWIWERMKQRRAADPEAEAADVRGEPRHAHVRELVRTPRLQ